jgi:hypothetical protein
MNVNTEEELRELFLQEECKQPFGSRADCDLQKILHRRGVDLTALRAKKAAARAACPAVQSSGLTKS